MLTRTPTSGVRKWFIVPSTAVQHATDLLLHAPRERYMPAWCVNRPADAMTLQTAVRNLPTTEIWELLYDTPNYDLLRERHWLVARGGVWYLRMDTVSTGGAILCTGFDGDEAVAKVHEYHDVILSDLRVVVTLITTRVNVTAEHWIDCTTWSRWKQGYYTVDSEVHKSMVNALHSAPETTVMDRYYTCLHHIRPPGLPLACIGGDNVDVSHLVTQQPTFGPSWHDRDDVDVDAAEQEDDCFIA